MSASAPGSLGAFVWANPTICIDFKNPKAYLALQPTYALEAELGIVFDWLPLIVSAMGRPQAERADEDRGSRHRRMRAEYYEHDLERYARIQGIEFSDLYRNPDTTVASIGLLWVNERAPSIRRAYVDTVFARYWGGLLNIEDRAAIGALLWDVGADVVGWDAYVNGPGRESLAQMSAHLREAGLFDVPGYVVDNEIFFGRQHLPMIGWILGGRLDEVPI